MTKKITNIWVMFVVLIQIILVTENNVIYSTYASITIIVPFLIHIFIHRKIVTIDIFNTLYIIFVIYLIISSLWLPFFIETRVFNRPIIISIFLLLIYNLCKWSNGFEFIMIAFIIIEYINFAIYLTDFPKFFFGDIYMGSRFQGTFENSNGAGFCFLISMIFSLYFIKKIRSRLKLFLLHTCLVTGIVLILATGSKKCVLGLLVVAIIYIPILLNSTTIKDNVRKILLLVATILLLPAFSSILQLETIYTNTSKRFLDFGTQIEAGNARIGHGSTAERIALIKLGLQKIPDKIFIGHGYDSFRHYFGLVSHCNYIELLFNGGIVALLIYYCRYFFALKATLKMNRNKDICFATIILLALLEIGSISFYSKLFLYAFTAIILLIENENASKKRYKKNPSNSSMSSSIEILR